GKHKDYAIEYRTSRNIMLVAGPANTSTTGRSRCLLTTAIEADRTSLDRNVDALVTHIRIGSRRSMRMSDHACASLLLDHQWVAAGPSESTSVSSYHSLSAQQPETRVNILPVFSRLLYRVLYGLLP